MCDNGIVVDKPPQPPIPTFLPRGRLPSHPAFAGGRNQLDRCRTQSIRQNTRPRTSWPSRAYREVPWFWSINDLKMQIAGLIRPGDEACCGAITVAQILIFHLREGVGSRRWKQSMRLRNTSSAASSWA
jgi:hypothetical protein